MGHRAALKAAAALFAAAAAVGPIPAVGGEAEQPPPKAVPLFVRLQAAAGAPTLPLALDPAALRPLGAAEAAGSRFGEERPGAASARPGDGDSRSSARTGPGDDPEARAPRPGGFGTDATKVPSRFFKEGRIAPRVTPDVALVTGDRTTVGLFGEVRAVKPGVANPTWRDRELGGGVTFQYRFGTK